MSIANLKLKVLSPSDDAAVLAHIRQNFYATEPLVLGTAWLNKCGNNDEFDIVSLHVCVCVYTARSVIYRQCYRFTEHDLAIEKPVVFCLPR